MALSNLVSATRTNLLEEGVDMSTSDLRAFAAAHNITASNCHRYRPWDLAQLVLESYEDGVGTGLGSPYAV